MEPLAIFEIGINHMGSKARALRMVDALVAQGATHLTMQALVEPVAYSRDPAAATLQPFCLSLEEISDVISHVCAAGARMGVAVLDPDHVKPLFEMGASFFKVLSSDITYTQLHLAVAQIGVPLYLSTAASTPEEISHAVDLVRSSYPAADVRLIHTVFPIPTPASEINLSAIPFLKERVGVPIAYGQHSDAKDAFPAAVAAGAETIFVYVAEERSSQLPDGPHALLCSEAGELLEVLARTHAMMGSYDRVLNEKEASMRPALRRSVVASRLIFRGETITREMVGFKRPGTGIPAWEVGRVIGSTAKRDYSPNEDIL